MSDGGPFAGNLVASPPDMVRMVDDELVTARALTPADVGNHDLLGNNGALMHQPMSGPSNSA